MKFPGLLLALLIAAPHASAQEPAPVDAFHPDGKTAAEPAYGGRVVVHLYGLPKNVNRVIENSGYARWMHYEIHEYLILRDWETWEYEPVLCTSWDKEDSLVLKSSDDSGEPRRVYGKLSEDGDAYVLTPTTPGHALSEPLRVPKSEVDSVELGTVYTFALRDDVKWHDGHPFNAQDVYFSWSAYHNPDVDCDSSRSYIERIYDTEVIDDHTIRFFFDEQYFRTDDTFDTLTILPSHLYNLRDPDHAQYDAKASDQDQAREINENPHNRQWVGLGPYKVTTYDQQYIQAERFADYFDPENGGYFDTIRWRHIPSEDTSYQALINGDLDFTMRLQADDYFGEATQAKSFTEDFYKGYYYYAAFNYIPWNLRKPLFKDLRVRKALAMGYDLEGMLKTYYHGLGNLPTGSQYFYGQAYNQEVERLPFDPGAAEDLLIEAGWYDHDGDGIIDKDGIPFRFDFMITPGSSTSAFLTQGMKEAYGELGIEMNIVAFEWATFLERLYDREFDGAVLAWSLDLPESDPKQLWHSSGAPLGVRGSNHPGVDDPYVDELIAKGNRELDPEKRWKISKELHRYLYEEVQPYFFGVMPPRKFAMNKGIRGMQTFAIAPGYSVRRWYYPEGTPGTRSTRE
jgi:peptide/nickel transport system substrate-binding protein